VYCSVLLRYALYGYGYKGVMLPAVVMERDAMGSLQGCYKDVTRNLRACYEGVMLPALVMERDTTQHNTTSHYIYTTYVTSCGHAA
jgi:AMMECR1 domain-containing protein